jgi:hypothetical protein
MENPHAERQAVLLERILKNTVRTSVCWVSIKLTLKAQQSKCTEMIVELNHCVEVKLASIGMRSGLCFRLRKFYERTHQSKPPLTWQQSIGRMYSTIWRPFGKKMRVDKMLGDHAVLQRVKVGIPPSSMFEPKGHKY